MPSSSVIPESQPRPGAELRRWPLLAWLLPLLPLAALLASSLELERRLPLRLQPGVAVSSEPFQLLKGGWGAPELRLQVALPANSSATYNLDLLDRADRPVLQLSKDGWREQSRWSEDGESGVEDNKDSDVELSLRPVQTGMYRLRVELTELLDAAGRPLEQPLTAELRVRNHSVNGPLLGFTALIAAGMVLVALRAFVDQGRHRHQCRRRDRRLDLRAVIGGPGLVRLELKARYAPGLRPPGAKEPALLELLVCDAAGRRCLRRRLPLAISQQRGDGATLWIATARLHLRCPEPGSRRLRVTLPYQLPGCSALLEWGELTVLDGARVLGNTPVIPVPETMAPRD